MKRALYFFFKRSLPVVLPLATGLILILIIQAPRSVISLSILLAGGVTAGLLIMMRGEGASWQVRVRALCIALYFLAGAIGLQLIAEEAVFQYVIIGVTMGIFSMYAESLFVLTYRPEVFTKAALENVAMYPGVLGLIGVSASLVAFAVYLSLPIIWFVPVVVLGSGVVSFHIWRTAVKSTEDIMPSVIGISVLMGALWYVLAQLPITFWVIGIIVALWWYVCTHVLRTYWYGALTKRRTSIMVGIASAITLISLLVSRWV